MGIIGLDDYITVFCIAVLLVGCVLVSIASHHGLGKRVDALEPEEIPRALKWNVITSSFLVWAFSLPKFAIIAILKRILDYGLKTTVLFWSLALTSQASILATSIWWWKQCDPVEYGWNKDIEGKCADYKIMATMGYVVSAYAAFLDLFFALYPIPFIMRLNMRLRSRITVSIALGLSSLAFFVSIYKLVIFGQVFEQLALKPTYPTAYLNILGVAEGCILIICASMPTLGPLVHAFRRSLMSSAARSSQVVSDESFHGWNVWSHLKGHKLGNVEIRGSPLEAQSSVDDIPLFNRPGFPKNETVVIQKKTEFTLSVE